jgi:hypothetical protein
MQLDENPLRFGAWNNAAFVLVAAVLPLFYQRSFICSES